VSRVDPVGDRLVVDREEAPDAAQAVAFEVELERGLSALPVVAVRVRARRVPAAARLALYALAAGAGSQPGAQPSLLLDSLEAYRRTVLLQRAGAHPAEIRRQGGGASTLILRAGDPSADAEGGDAAAFAQDDWGLRPNLNLSYGLRWSKQRGIGGAGDFEPRFGFAWAPGSARINGGLVGPQLVIRGGAGLYHVRIDDRLRLLQAQTDPARTRQYVFTDPAMLDGFPAVPGPSELADAPGSSTARWALDERVRPATLLYVTAAVERKLGLLSTLSLNYSFSGGSGLLRAEASGGRPAGEVGDRV